MARPQKNRIVKEPPLYSSFKPTGVMRKQLDQIMLTLDEYEAIRLADFLEKEQEEAASEMEISRPTFTRLVERARKKIASFIIEGKELYIEGGSIHFLGNIIRCLECEGIFSTGFDGKIVFCPTCGSKRIVDLAGGYGHGNCCRRNLGNK